jgi:hypothetical protein
MPASSNNLYWDSCVFIRFLTRSPTDLLSDIDQYMREAKAGKLLIHCSALVFTEIKPRFLKPAFGTIDAFFAVLGSAVAPFDPNPNILSWAGRLRDHVPVNPSDPLRRRGKPAIHWHAGRNPSGNVFISERRCGRKKTSCFTHSTVVGEVHGRASACR